MNEYDTELVRAILKSADYTFVEDETAADIVMLNTCAIREHAHRKVYGRIHEIRHKRRTRDEGREMSNDLRPSSIGNHRPLIGILGCMATNLRTELLENRNLDIDFIAGPDSYKRLPQLIEEAMAYVGRETRDVGRGTSNILRPSSTPTFDYAQSGPRPSGGSVGVVHRKPFDVTLSEFETYSDVYPHRNKGVNAWIAVMRGCNNFCTFCVVPYTRGRERSRAPSNIFEEAHKLAEDGFKQVTLLGQNVNSYTYEGHDFADLLDKVSEVKGIERIRFTSPHPKDFPRKLIKVIAQNPKICKQLHMPLQSGSNRILDLMARSYTREEFYDLVAEARATIPGVALSTDIIVGFCTETDEDFDDTLRVMRRVKFDSAFTFKYSQREGTIAKRDLADDVPDAVKTERIVRLNELQKEISYQRNREHVGKTLKVLIESEAADKSDKECFGRADNNKTVLLPGGYKPGEMVEVRVTYASPFNLKGIPVPA